MTSAWVAPRDYEGWLRHCFDRPVKEPKWYHRRTTNETCWEPSHLEFLAYAAQAFENPKDAFSRFSDAQVNQGLWYLIDSGFSDNIFAIVDEQIPWPKRRRLIRAIGNLYKEYFAKRCMQTLSHLNEKPSSELNGVCYIWWDLLPIHGKPDKPERKELDPEMLRVMTETLSIPHVACQEAALHGLGHWALYYPQQVAATVDQFLEWNPAARPELLEYARSARTGMVP